ncbi:MAG: hypothetical protein M3121_06790, partial [Chloroflexota bacterium]|nr:hypothetical protein [Chloroflexota bacterium]
MDQRSLNDGLQAHLTRRAALRGAGAVGLTGALAARGIEIVTAQEATPAAAAYPEVVITATEYEFDVQPTIDGGWTTLTLDNQGMEEHQAFLLQPTGDATIDDVMAALETPEFSAFLEVANARGGLPNVDPGQRASVVMNLAPGEYVLVCAVPDENGTPHYMLGMHAQIEVTELAGNALPPFADTKITMIEFGFEGLPAEVSAGSTRWEVFNDGEQVHQLNIYRLQEGVTFETVQGIFGVSPEASPSPMANPAGHDHTETMGTPPASPVAA